MSLVFCINILSVEYNPFITSPILPSNCLDRDQRVVIEKILSVILEVNLKQKYLF